MKGIIIVKKVNNICMNIEEYKKQNQEYLMQMQRFFDIADNIKDEKLKKNIIYQKIRCDEILENLIIRFFQEQKTIK